MKCSAKSFEARDLINKDVVYKSLRNDVIGTLIKSCDSLFILNNNVNGCKCPELYKTSYKYSFMVGSHTILKVIE